MAVTPQGGMGLLLKINTGSLVTIPSVLDADFPKFKKFIAESTGHDATSGYYTSTTTGKRRIEPFSAILAWDIGDATQAAIRTNFNADTSVQMSIADPDGDETITFQAHVEELERMSDQEDVYKCRVLIHPTGAPTITP